MNIQEQITNWHLATFGPHCTNERIERKLVEEVMECRLALSDGADWPQEAADVVICLMALCGRNNVDLLAEVVKKFEVVKARGMSQVDRDRQRGIV